MNLLRLEDGFLLNTDAICSIREELDVVMNRAVIKDALQCNARWPEHAITVPEPLHGDVYRISMADGAMTLSGINASRFGRWLRSQSTIN